MGQLVFVEDGAGSGQVAHRHAFIADVQRAGQQVADMVPDPSPVTFSMVPLRTVLPRPRLGRGHAA
ncbi:hypothetical protein [Paracoccus luteus]|uniref:hypothetical protein n=1 Tax=Paracoccus luteus TaxID=2508543 RepID=UPI0010700FBC|nr:hypothetical protein [Paracoccus luteus]